jgi:integrator complex subunit 9
MLDCGLNMQSVLNFMPMPMVPSARFNSLPNWVPRDNYQDWQIEGVRKAE